MSAVYHGGGLDFAIDKYGGKRDAWLDLSTGINPNAYPIPEIKPHSWTALPDSKSEVGLLKAATNYYNLIDGQGIVAGNGTQALMQILPSVLKVSHVAIVSPTYEEHSHIWLASGAKVSEVENVVDFPQDADCLIAVNPNNPDARSWQPADLILAAEKLKYLIVDEAFCDAYEETSLASTLPDNVFILRSFGKFFGLAGLRLGFLLGNQDIINDVKARLGPWSVSGPALEIGTTAFQDNDWVHETIINLEKNSKALAIILDAAGLTVVGRNRLFVFAEVKKAKKLFEHLCSKKILVRPFEKMPDKIRFGLCANEEELSRLEKAIKAFG